MKLDLSKCDTSAQSVTKICYNESTRNLNIRIACEDLKDLQKCVKIIKRYNEFDYKIVNQGLDEYASIKRYYNEGNPNNGKDALEFEIAREGSVAMYVKFYEWNNRKLIGSTMQVLADGKTIREYTAKEFKDSMEKLALIAKADECDFNEEGGSLVCRLWWD